MARLTAQGLIDDGTDDLTVQGTILANEIAKNVGVLQGSASFGAAGEAADGSRGSYVPIPGPGFYSVAITGSADVITQRGASGFTGSLPSAASFPGGEIVVRGTNVNYDYLLTGSMAIFSGSGLSAGSVKGTKLLVKSGATVGLKSDYTNWIIMHCSGTVTLSGIST